MRFCLFLMVFVIFEVFFVDLLLRFVGYFLMLFVV